MIFEGDTDVVRYNALLLFLDDRRDLTAPEIEDWILRFLNMFPNSVYGSNLIDALDTVREFGAFPSLD